MKLSRTIEARVLELAGVAPSVPPPAVGGNRPQQPPDSCNDHPCQRSDDLWSDWRLVVPLPGVRVVSEANRRDHWAVRHGRASEQRAAVLAALAGVPVPAGRVRVTLVRRGGRRLDSDNLAGAFKACRDAVAQWLGVDDGDDERVRWRCVQRPGRGAAGCRVVVRPG